MMAIGIWTYSSSFFWFCAAASESLFNFAGSTVSLSRRRFARNWVAASDFRTVRQSVSQSEQLAVALLFDRLDNLFLSHPLGVALSLPFFSLSPEWGIRQEGGRRTRGTRTATEREDSLGKTGTAVPRVNGYRESRELIKSNFILPSRTQIRVLFRALKKKNETGRQWPRKEKNPERGHVGETSG